MNRTEATMDDLPELPFEQILSYLSVEDRLKSRAVSRSWRRKFDFKLKSLCCSDVPIGFVWDKNRLVNGAFARNFFGSPRFASFFDTFSGSIFSNLKRLRLCGIPLNEENATTFVRTLNSFGQLEELDLFSCSTLPESSSDPVTEFELKLPMLASIHFENVGGIKTLTLDAPKLQKARFVGCNDLLLVIVHRESVERLLTDNSKCTAVNQLKNLLYLYIKCPAVDSTLLAGLDQLKEIHLYHSDNVSVLFEQKRRYGRTNLKIYLCGLLLNGPDDPAIRSLSSDFDRETLVQLTENPLRLADEIPFLESLYYSGVERVAPQAAIDLVSRFSNLYQIFIDRPVRDIGRFLDILKNSYIDMLEFVCDQPQELFDRLSEYSVLQLLAIHSELPDLRFLPKLKHLIQFELSDWSIDVELIRKLFEELPFFLQIDFVYNDKWVGIHMPKKWTNSKRFAVSVGYGKETEVPDLEAAIQFIVENVPQESD